VLHKNNIFKNNIIELNNFLKKFIRIIIMSKDLEKRYSSIIKKTQRSLDENKRERNSLEITAISKRQPLKKINFFIEKGIKTFGENRVQDAFNRWKNINRQSIKIHLVGPLQTNKAEDAVNFFDVIESLDREKLANALCNHQKKLSKYLDYFVQINTGQENQKSGIIPKEADDFIKLCKSKYSLNVVGLMCIPPVNENPSLHFALLREISKRNNLEFLSMGMSNDYEEAIAFGATHLRIGTALFGKRTEKEEI
tara:strand:- start:1430 stop:2188 length:759 start_codon:yes stop_codon:yes gene_type:complete